MTERPGEHSPIAHRLEPGGGLALWVLGSIYTFKARGRDTAGAYAIVEATVFEGQGPPPHIHHAEDECFFVLEGNFSFQYEDQSIEGGPGTFLRVPRGVLHTFRNAGHAPGRVLLTVAPAGLDEFWEKVGHPVSDPAQPPPDDPEEMERILELAPQYHLELRP
ncbi:cupin domain-containing protein [Tundrisphaera lichenicola]|uniref:cupin domain-containing protein n=1 Tax=Tundrisphaera lichenicola TaxID=2029860 RepID=UPI003EBC5C83